MNRYIDADVFAEKMERKYCESCDKYQGIRCNRCSCGDWLDALYFEPTADVVEVVRCKDCKYILQYEQINVCCNVNSFLQEPKYVSDHDFCSRGERKEE